MTLQQDRFGHALRREFPEIVQPKASAVQMLDEGPVACANIAGPKRSPCPWHGECGQVEETGVLLKSDATLLGTAEARLGLAHACPASGSLAR